MIRNIIVKNFTKAGIGKNHLGFPKRYRLWGADTETIDGDPYTLQFSIDGLHADLIYVNRDTVLDKFLNYIYPLLWQGQTNIIYFHNLEFDLAVLFCKYHKLWVGNSFIKARYKGWDIDLCVGKVCFAFFKHKKSNCALKILDSRAFFTNVEKSGLGALCEQLKLPVQKLKYDERWEKRKPTKEEQPLFEQYAKTDACAQWHLAQWIVKQHKEYDIRICVSSPQFASRVFKHYYFKGNDKIKLPDDMIVDACILSYHGGKNGFYLDQPTVVKNCYEVDIVSAYPYAMTKLPNFLSGEYDTAWKYTDKYEGVWCITGTVKDCRYPCLFSHDFKPLKGKVDEVWVTSYELREALKMKEIDLKSCYGYIWKPDGKATHNPLADYVKHFFKKKQETPKTDNRYMMYKILMNSLYGKFIQTVDDKRVEVDWDDETAVENATVFVPDMIYDKKTKKYIPNPEKKEKQYFAGGLFNPMIATLITGFTRVQLHQLEHKYKALHASTDSIKTQEKPVEDENLGGVTIQCYGTCYLFRNKLYLHYDEQGNLKKFALHGFQGRANQLRELFDSKGRKYKIRHLFKVREAYRQGKKALAMQEVDREVDIDFSRVDYI